MTRNEAKENLYYGIQFDTLKIDKFIDKVYDDFESRTCKSCKYFTSSPNTNKYDCCEKGIADTSISFCCNKWEVRDESIRDTKFN